jgi:high mobility group protein B2
MSSSLQTYLDNYEVTERQAAKRLGVSGSRTGYIIFSTDERKKHDNMSMTELSKIIGSAWKELDDSERERYQQLAVEDKERFHRELEEAFVALDGQPLPELKKKRLPKKVTVAKQLGVKGALTSYICYSMDVKDKIKTKYPDLPMTEIVKKIASSWKTLSAAKKKKYEKMAQKDKERYQREIQEGMENHPNIRNEVLEVNARIRGEKVRKRRNTYGVKSARSAYILYSSSVRNEVRRENPDMRMTEVSKVIAQMWNNLSTEDREPFVQQAREDRERFNREFLEAQQRNQEQKQEQEQEQQDEQTNVNITEENQTDESEKKTRRRRRVKRN